YIDAYGNLVTGIAGSALGDNRTIRIASQELAHAGTFSAVAPGALFWYRNSSGLIEISANQARADALLGAAIGAAVEVI
ncbi:MAG: SAM hydroxide adenosyltransferase, partial [Rickettsiales bacterium]